MNKENIFKILTGHIVEVIPELEGRAFSSTDSLRELGANSVDRADIIMMTLETLSLQSSLVDFVSAQNIGELVEIIYEKCR